MTRIYGFDVKRAAKGEQAADEDRAVPQATAAAASNGTLKSHRSVVCSVTHAVHQESRLDFVTGITEALRKIYHADRLVAELAPR